MGFWGRNGRGAEGKLSMLTYFQKKVQIPNSGNILIIFFLIVIYLAVQLPLLTQLTSVWCDEPWYANPAYNFSINKGPVDTCAKSGDFQRSCIHTTGLSVVYRLFGCSLLTSRLFSVAAGLFGLIGFLLIIRKYSRKTELVLLGGLLFIFSNIHFIIFRTVRPEGVMLSIVIWSVYFLLEAMHDDKKSSFLFSGLLVSSSFLCHPHGAIFILIFSVMLFVHSIREKSWNGFLLFIIGCSVMGMVFAYYNSLVSSKNVFQTVLGWAGGSRTSFGNTANEQVSLVHTMMTFFNHYTLGLKRLYIFIFEICALFAGLFYFKRNRIIFQLSLIGVVYLVLAFLFLSSFATRHFADVTTFSFLAFVLILADLQKRGYLKVRYFVLGLGVLYLLNNIAGDAYVMYRDSKQTPYSKIERQIDELVPDDTNVVTLLNFWFPLKNNNVFNTYTRWNRTRYKNLDNLLSSGDVDYVVISDYLAKGRTATSGRKETSSTADRYAKYYDTVTGFAKSNGNLLQVINTTNYGDIEIWKIK